MLNSNVPLVDQRTGLMSREWFRFFEQLNILVQSGGGGGGGVTTLNGDVTGSGTGTISTVLAAVPVVAGSYTNADITVDAKGRVIAASGNVDVIPGGSTTQVQYNNAGAFAGNANFTYDAGTNTVTFGNVTGSALAMTIQPKAPTVLEDSGNLIIKTADAVKANSTTGDVRINPGKATGSILAGPLVLRGGSSSNNFSSSISLFGSSPTNGGGLSLVSAGGPTAGSFLLQAGTGTGSGGIGGAFLLTAGGSSGANGTGGSFNAEAGSTSGVNGAAGAVTFTAGSAFAGGFPGNINFNLGYDGLGVNFASIYFNGPNNTAFQITDDGTAELIAFFGATPVVKQTTSIASATRTAVGGAAVNTNDTFGGYTIGQIVTALKAYGLLV